MASLVPGVANATPFSAVEVTRVINNLQAPSPHEAQQLWLQHVAQRVVSARPDLADILLEILQITPASDDLLTELTIGEIGVCYEALLATLDRGLRRRSGQYFTPDDAAAFMASHHADFPEGTWLDPCCGVGNLSWHLANQHPQPSQLIRDHLVLIDKDATALKTAVTLIAADFAAPGDVAGVKQLWQRCQVRDFLAPEPLPHFDFAILNPPYAAAPAREGFRTSATRDLFAYFLERVATSANGFIAVTPASYLAIPKHQTLRECLNTNVTGGDVYVYDNVPDTLFRGYKFGSENTSKTNFVRAAITVASPTKNAWRITPILRWTQPSRQSMFNQSKHLLNPRRIGPDGEWCKIPPHLEGIWDSLRELPTTLRDLLSHEETPYSLTVATTPRYYISAAFRPLARSSKLVLHFPSQTEQFQAAAVLNSSLPYLWWRVLDGGVSLPRRVLLSTPIPPLPHDLSALIEWLRESEQNSLVTKLNAGKVTENIKHPPHVVQYLNSLVIPDAVQHLAKIYAQNMFSS